MSVPTFKFGKYNGKTADEVFEKDRKYISWLFEQSFFKEKNTYLFNYLSKKMGNENSLLKAPEKKDINTKEFITKRIAYLEKELEIYKKKLEEIVEQENKPNEYVCPPLDDDEIEELTKIENQIIKVPVLESDEESDDVDKKMKNFLKAKQEKQVEDSDEYTDIEDDE